MNIFISLINQTRWLLYRGFLEYNQSEERYASSLQYLLRQLHRLLLVYYIWRFQSANHLHGHSDLNSLLQGPSLCQTRRKICLIYMQTLFFVKSGSMTTDALMFDAMGNRIPDDSLSGILDIFHYDPIWNWHWNAPSRLYVLTLLIVSGPAGEKKSFNFMRAKSESLGSAA